MFLSLVGTTLLATACAAVQAVPGTAPEPHTTLAQRHFDQTLREAKTESSQLRAEMAAARIAAAKKEAELHELHRQLTDIEQSRAQQRQQVEAKQQELVVLRAERDQLRQGQNEAQVQLAELPQLRQAAGEAKALEARVERRLNELESALARLTAELVQVKESLEQSRVSPKTKPHMANKSGGGLP